MGNDISYSKSNKLLIEYDFNEFMDLVEKHGEVFTPELFDDNINSGGCVTLHRALNLRFARDCQLKIDNENYTIIKFIENEKFTLGDLLVAGYTIKMLRKANVSYEGMELIEPLEPDWSLITKKIDNNNMTLLHYASSLGYYDVSHALMKKEADPEAMDGKYWLPCHWACYRGHDKLALSFIDEYGVLVDSLTKDQMTPFFIACMKNNQNLAAELLKRDANINHCNKDGETSLLQACYSNSTSIALWLLDQGADPNIGKPNGFMPLHWACRHGQFQLALKLLMCGAEIDARTENGDTPIMFLPDEPGNDSTLRKALIDRNADMTSHFFGNYTPLHHICASAKTVDTAYKASIEVEALCRRGADVNAVSDEFQMTPLHIALERSPLSDEIVFTLVNYGADFNAATIDGSTPLLRACFHENITLVEYLIEKNAKVMVQDNRGYTCMHWACCRGSLEMVKLLLNTKDGTHLCKLPNDQGFPPHLFVDREKNQGKEIYALMQENGADEKVFKQLRLNMMA